MPIYEYELSQGSCAACGGRFAFHRLLGVAPLTVCPDCGRPVRKLISASNLPRITRPMSHMDAKKAGFTVLKRIGRGEYERQ